MIYDHDTRHVKNYVTDLQFEPSMADLVLQKYTYFWEATRCLVIELLALRRNDGLQVTLSLRRFLDLFDRRASFLAVL